MSELAGTLNRIFTAVLGLSLFLVGAWAIGDALNWPPARYLVENVDWREATTWSLRDGWSWILTAVATVGVLFIALLVWANFRSRQPQQVYSRQSNETGTIDYSLQLIAKAVADDIATLPNVTRARGKAELDRGTETLTIIVDVPPQYDVVELRDELIRQRQYIASAVEGRELAVRFLIHLGTVSRESY